MGDQRHLLQPRRALGEMVIDRTVEHAAGDRPDSKLFPHEPVQHVPRTQVLHEESRERLHRLAARGRDVQQRVQAFPGVRFQQQDSTAPAGQRQAQRCGERRLPHPALAGDDEQLTGSQLVQQVIQRGASARRGGDPAAAHRRPK